MVSSIGCSLGFPRHPHQPVTRHVLHFGRGNDPSCVFRIQLGYILRDVDAPDTLVAEFGLGPESVSVDVVGGAG